jgi:hypothetical protein
MVHELSKKLKKFIIAILGLTFTVLAINFATVYRAQQLVIGKWDFKNKHFSETITFYPNGVVEWDFEPEAVSGDDFASSYKYGHLVGSYVVSDRNTIFAKQKFYRDQSDKLDIYPDPDFGVSKDDMQFEFTYTFGPDDSICYKGNKSGFGGLCYKRTE